MINYKGTPLLGEDSNPQHTSEFFAIAGTVLFWLIFSIFSFVIKPQPEKPKYKEVQIVLSSTPVVQKTEETPDPAEAASASAASSESLVEQVVETPAVEVPAVEAPAPKVETPPVPTANKPAKQNTPKQSPKMNVDKSADKKDVPVPAVPDNTVYSMDLTNGFDFNSIQKIPKNSNQMWDLMDDAESNTNETDKPVKVNWENSTAGAAGIASDNDSSSIKSSNSQSDNKNYEVTSRGNIQNVLNAKDYSSSESGNGNNPDKSNSSNKDSITWTDGASSRSVYSFDTELSQKAKSSMQVSKSTPFTITFSVDADGNVMATTIVIKNEFILSEIIMKEMKEKISSWKFGKGSGISKARFDWILSPGN